MNLLCHYCDKEIADEARWIDLETGRAFSEEDEGLRPCHWECAPGPSVPEYPCFPTWEESRGATTFEILIDTRHPHLRPGGWIDPGRLGEVLSGVGFRLEKFSLPYMRKMWAGPLPYHCGYVPEQNPDEETVGYWALHREGEGRNLTSSPDDAAAAAEANVRGWHTREFSCATTLEITIDTRKLGKGDVDAAAIWSVLRDLLHNLRERGCLPGSAWQGPITAKGEGRNAARVTVGHWVLRRDEEAWRRLTASASRGRTGAAPRPRPSRNQG